MLTDLRNQCVDPRCWPHSPRSQLSPGYSRPFSLIVNRFKQTIYWRKGSSSLGRQKLRKTEKFSKTRLNIAYLIRFQLFFRIFLNVSEECVDQPCLFDHGVELVVSEPVPQAGHHLSQLRHRQMTIVIVVEHPVQSIFLICLMLDLNQAKLFCTGCMRHLWRCKCKIVTAVMAVKHFAQLYMTFLTV